MKNLQRFLEESNAIEGVYDADSYKQAKVAWEYCISQDKLTVGVMLKTHKILMLHQDLMPNEKGYLRTVPVYIGGREAMDSNLIYYALMSWCDECNYLQENGSELTMTPERAKAGEQIFKAMHVQYEKIHPFVDGNGRTGRIFLNWQRVKAGLPILVIDESKKHDYYKWFSKL